MIKNRTPLSEACMVALAYVFKNPGMHMVMIPTRGVDPSIHCKQLCDFDLVTEVDSYCFVPTRAGRSIAFRIIDGPRDLPETCKPWTEAEIAFDLGNNIRENPYTDNGYARDLWHSTFIGCWERNCYDRRSQMSYRPSLVTPPKQDYPELIGDRFTQSMKVMRREYRSDIAGAILDEFEDHYHAHD